MKTLQNLARLALIAAALNINQQATAATWTSTGSLGTARYLHTATLLPNGKVLVAGGNTATGITTSAELYDPSAGTWTAAFPMNIARAFHTATLLPNGKVLVAGGFGGSPPANPLNKAELYDPVTGTWTNTSGMTSPRGYHKAALLPTCQVLLAGGSDSAFNPLSSADVFTPTTGQWTNTGAMKSPRAGFAMLTLPNGKVLAAGGQDVIDNAVNTAELYDPATATWLWTTSMANERADHTACLLPNGGALLVDGWSDTTDTPSSEIFNPTAGTWSTAATFSNPRFHVRAILLSNGKVLATGGKNSSQSIFSTAQLYDTGSGPISPPTLACSKALPNTPLQLAFTSRYGSVFSVIANGNIATPLNAWPVIGIATETSPGQFQFTDS